MYKQQLFLSNKSSCKWWLVCLHCVYWRFQGWFKWCLRWSHFIKVAHVVYLYELYLLWLARNPIVLYHFIIDHWYPITDWGHLWINHFSVNCLCIQIWYTRKPQIVLAFGDKIIKSCWYSAGNRVHFTNSLWANAPNLVKTQKLVVCKY